MFKIRRYVKIRFKNRGPPCYFLSSRGQKIKIITKIEQTILFLFTFLVSFFMAPMSQKLIYIINIFGESAKLRPLACSRVNVPCVPTCLACLCAHVPTCLACSRAHVPTCLACLRAHVLTCQHALRALRAYVLTCYNYK